MLSDPAAASSPEEAYEMLLNKIFNFTEDNSPTKEGLKVYLDKANISYKKTEKTNDRSVRLIIISLLYCISHCGHGNLSKKLRISF